MMKLDAKKFRKVMAKATLNYSIDFVQLRFVDGRVKSSMISNHQQIVTKIDIPNDGILETTLQDDITINFSSPSVLLVPYLEDIGDLETTAKIDDENLLLFLDSGWNEYSVRFVTDSVIRNYLTRRSISDEFPYFYDEPLTDEMRERYFESLKRLGARHGKIYISVIDGKIYFEATDRTNAFSNKMNSKPLGTTDINDVAICFEYKNFVSLSNIIEHGRAEGQEFTIKFAHIHERDKGIIHVSTADNSEQYFLLNREN